MGSKNSRPENINKNGKAEPKQSQQSSPSRRGRQQKFAQQCVFEEDDREVVQEDSRLQFIGLIRGKFKSKPQTHIGTGAIISEDLILTVAHNVCSINTREFRKYKEFLRSALDSSISTTNSSSLSEPSDRLSLSFRAMTAEKAMAEFKHAEFAEWIEFYPAAGALRGVGSLDELGWRQNEKACRVKQFKVHPCFITHPNHQMYDLCLLQLETPLSPHTHNMRILENYHNIATEISVFGYPLDLCFREEAGTVIANQFGAKGRFTLDEDAGKISYKIATGRGQSGSPIFINTSNAGKTEYFCIGVHNGGNQQLGSNTGVHLNQEKMKWLSEAEEQLTGKISKIASAKLPKLPDNNVPVKPPKDVNEKTVEEYEVLIKAANILCENQGKIPKQKIYLYREAALLRMNQQSYKQAIEHYQTFVKLLEALPEQDRNEDDEDEWEAALINLAKSYCEIGQFQRSLQLYEETEAKCKELLRLSVEKQSLILNNKGAVLIHLQKWEEALGFFELAYKLRRERFGQENILTYNCLENIASVKCKLGLPSNESISDYERVFKFKERRFGVGSREAIRTKGNLSLVLLAGKRYREGLENCHYCLEKLRLQSEGDDLAKFTKQFTQQMHELCRSDCTQQELKVAFGLCQKYELWQLARAIDSQWSKRRATQ